MEPGSATRCSWPLAALGFLARFEADFFCSQVLGKNVLSRVDVLTGNLRAGLLTRRRKEYWASRRSAGKKS